MTKNTIPSVHFIGIGGIGVSALARFFNAHGWKVSGSDGAKSELTRDLVREGIAVRIGHNASHIPANAHMVVYSQAIRPDNAERRAAGERDIPLLSYPEAIGKLTQQFTTVAIAGAHGKSTTTAMTARIAMKCKLDPTVIVGTKMKELGNSNFRAGKSKILILEADEFGRAFLHYSPALTVILNIDREHLDIYKDLADIKNTFLKLASATQESGTLVLNADDKNVASLKARFQKIAKERDLRVIWFTAKSALGKEIAKSLKVPGAHNLSNAIAALTAAQVLGIKKEAAIKAVSGFEGTWRRMDLRGEIKIGSCRVAVMDDYAHHPTEIAATLAAVRSAYPDRIVVCAFQPHQAARLAALYKEFVNAFKDADAVGILPAYKVQGRDVASKNMPTSEDLIADISKNYRKIKASYCPTLWDILPFASRVIEDAKAKKALLVMMGAGDIFLATQKIISK